MADVTFTTAWYGDWQAISLAAAAISVIIASMLVMLGRLLELRNLEQTAKSEFVYAISTVLIVILVVGLLPPFESLLAAGDRGVARTFYLTGFKCDVATGPVFSQNTLIDWMKLYLAAPASCVQKFMKFLYFLSIPVEALASQYMEIFMSEVASGFGFKWLSSAITTATQGLTFYMYIYYLLFHVLNFIKYYSGFFFSIGVALRAFPPTRGAGAYIMALAFGLYFVFPLTYIALSALATPVLGSNTLVPEAGRCVIDTTEGSLGKDGLKFACALPQVPSDVTTMQCVGASVRTATEFKEMLESNRDTLTGFLSFQIAELIRHLLYAVCVFPVLAFLVLFTFVLNTTSLFGGTIPEVGRGLVKLI